MVHFLGQVDVAHFGHYKYWADAGIIHSEDTRTGAYKAIQVRQILHRMNALQDMLKASKEERDNFEYKEEIQFNEIQGFLETMIPIVQKAREQGMPSDPTCGHDLRVRRKKQVAVAPTEYRQAGTPMKAFF